MAAESSREVSGTDIALQAEFRKLPAVDALLLNIVPVLSLYGAHHPEELRLGPGRLYWGAVALAGSLLVTALYHLGFAEYRGRGLLQPLLGNAIITAGYLLTGNPLASLVAHVLMHVAAVLHGMEGTTQLPPHYWPAGS